MCFLPLTAGGNWQSRHGGGVPSQAGCGLQEGGLLTGARGSKTTPVTVWRANPEVQSYVGYDWWHYVLKQDLNASTLLWFNPLFLHQTSRRSRWTVQRQASLSPRPYLSRPPLLINCWRQQLPNRGGRMWYHRSFISNVAHCYKMLKLWVEDQSLLWGKCDWNEKKQQLEDGFVVTLASTCA